MRHLRHILLFITSMLVPITCFTDKDSSASVWLSVFSLLCFLWIGQYVALICDTHRSFTLLVIQILIFAACLLPYLPEAYTFFAWSIGGFAP